MKIQIDNLEYKLYELMYEEVLVVEPAFSKFGDLTTFKKLSNLSNIEK
jgi:hypothetical protein